MKEEFEAEFERGATLAARRILKVRLPQQQVIKLHELRIVQGTSIANLIESLLDDYFSKLDRSQIAEAEDNPATVT